MPALSAHFAPMIEAAAFQFNPSLSLVMGAAVAWYLAARVVEYALAGASATAGQRAIAYWLPTAMVALLGVVVNQQQIAVAAIFSSSVASMSLVAGVVTLTAPRISETASKLAGYTQAPDRRRWALLLPVGILAMLAGFRGHFTMSHAAIFAAQGVAVLLIWRMPTSDQRLAYIGAAQPRSPVMVALQMLLALVLSIGGALAALRGGMLIGRQWELASNAMIGTLLLGPCLVMPMVGSSSLVAQRGEYSSAISSLVAVALLNMCLLLPVAIVTWNVSHVAPAQQDPLHLAVGAFRGEIDPPLFYPPSIWRVDATLLVVLGLWLLPISVGRWIPRRIEGVGLIIAYGVYLAMTAYTNVRW